MTDLGPSERDMLDWLGEARRQAGLGTLRPLPTLMAAARAKCEEIAGGGPVAHQGGRWGNPRRLQEAFGVRARVMGGENLAAYLDHGRAFLALMASPGHRANILHPDHDAVGVAVLRMPRGVAVCQEFAGGIFRT